MHRSVKSCYLFTILSFCVLSCKDNLFTGTKQVPQLAPPAPPPPPPLELKVVGLRPKALWKTCLYVALNGNEKEAHEIGCNKDSNLMGKTISLPADPKACNTLRFIANIHHNAEAKTVSCQRNMGREFDRQYFVAADLRLIRGVSTKVKVEGNLDEIQKAGQKAQTLNSKIIRLFIEDQVDAKLQKFVELAKGATLAEIEASRNKTGIDFNDFVIDINALNIPVTVEGTQIQCGAEQIAPISPPESKMPEGCLESSAK
jgi:hypothetical protein